MMIVRMTLNLKVSQIMKVSVYNDVSKFLLLWVCLCVFIWRLEKLIPACCWILLEYGNWALWLVPKMIWKFRIETLQLLFSLVSVICLNLNMQSWENGHGLGTAERNKLQLSQMVIIFFLLIYEIIVSEFFSNLRIAKISMLLFLIVFITPSQFLMNCRISSKVKEAKVINF